MSYIADFKGTRCLGSGEFVYIKKKRLKTVCYRIEMVRSTQHKFASKLHGFPYYVVN